jgi:hypothetical protein
MGIQLRNGRTRNLLVIAGFVGVLLMMVHWGGYAKGGPLLIAGIAALTALLLGFGFSVWYFYKSALPDARPVKVRTRTAAARQVLATLVCIAGLLFMIGGSWDEVWHRKYGLPLGEDFWWRPHILIYISIGLISLFALGAMLPILRGKGDMRRRFRAEPLLGLLALAAGYQVISTPLDPVWHQLYGVDLTAWSLPHLMLAIGFTGLMLTAIAIQLSLIPAGAWRTIRSIRQQEIFVLLMFAILGGILTQFGTAEWEDIHVLRIGSTPTFWMRPEWLYPVILISVSAFVGMMALYSLRLVGAATATGLLMLAARLVLLNALDAMGKGVGMTTNAYLLLLPPLLALDIGYAFRHKQAENSRTVFGGGLVIALAVLVISLPLLTRMMIYPRVNGNTLPGMVVFGVVMGLACAWVGSQLGAALRAHGTAPQTSTAEEAADRRVWWVGAGALTAMLLFVAFWIGTATPPIL